jgi:hypothetical protein
VLTVRPSDAWWRSIRVWIDCLKPFMRDKYTRLLGATEYSEAAFKRACVVVIVVHFSSCCASSLPSSSSFSSSSSKSLSSSLISLSLSLRLQFRTWLHHVSHRVEPPRSPASSSSFESRCVVALPSIAAFFSLASRPLPQ